MTGHNWAQPSTTTSICIILGFVALIAGGDGHAEVELYSPDGNCQHKLAPLPVASYKPVLAFIANMFLAYGGQGIKNC
jgi:hypothetical protein